MLPTGQRQDHVNDGAELRIVNGIFIHSLAGTVNNTNTTTNNLEKKIHLTLQLNINDAQVQHQFCH